MKFKRLYMRNFLAVGSEGVEIIFDNYNGLTLIRGSNQDVPGKSSNGSGKSTIIEGIFYALTGKTLRKISGDSILHNSNSKLCRVEIEFDNVKIIRTLEPTTVKLLIDGVDKSVAGSLKETKKLIDEQVGINFETLSNILIFGQHNMVSFLDAAEADKRDIIENLMNIREYNAYEEQARLMLREAKAKQKSLAEQHTIHENHFDEQTKVIEQQENVLQDFRLTLRREIANIEGRIGSIPDINELKSEWATFNTYVYQRRSFELQVQAIRDEQLDNSKSMRSVSEARDLEMRDRAPVVERLSLVQQKIPLLNERKAKMWNEIMVPMQQRMKDLEAVITKSAEAMPNTSSPWDGMIRAAMVKVTTSQRSYENIKSKVSLDGEVCPTCFGKVSADNFRSVLDALEIEVEHAKTSLEDLELQKLNDETKIKLEKNQEIAKAKVALGELEVQAAEEFERQKSEYVAAKERLDSMLKDAQDAVDQFDGQMAVKYDLRLKSLQTKLHDLDDQHAALERQTAALASVETPSVAVEDIGKLQSQLDALNKSKVDKIYQLDNNPHVDVIASLKESLAKTEALRDGIHEQIKDVERRLPYFEFWVSHMGKEGIKSYVIDQIIPTLNEQIEYWMSLIYQGAISVQFDKFFNVTMTNNSTGNLMVFGQGSGGERRRIDLAIMLAFRQVMKLSTGKDPSMLFFDEIAENLDEEGIYRLWDAMEDIAKDSTLFVITHNPTLLGLIQDKNKLEVVKKDGSMKLVA